MDYQLVFQFAGNSLADFEMLIRLEDELQACISTNAEVDGHDMGRGEINIFILTSSPTATFEQSKPLLSNMALLDKIAVAFRELDADNYTAIWPEDSAKAFNII